RGGLAMAGRRILGIDPGLQITGYGVVEEASPQPRLCEAGIIRSSDAGPTSDMAQRLVNLYNGIAEVIAQFQPEVAAVEQLYAHYDHPRTAILMAHARGVIFLAAGKKNMPVISYAATRIKKTITGHGRASKEQMQLAIMSELRLPKMPEPHDVSDALAAA